MWKPEHRKAARREGLRYDSDMTDAEWALVAPFIPPAKRGGRKREVDVREVLNAIFYVLWTGCQWKALPKDFPPKSTVHWYLTLWNWTARWSGSITRSMSLFASRKGAKPALPRRSSTARAPRGRQKGGFPRSPRL